MSAFDELAGQGGPLGLLGVAMQIPDVSIGLHEALATHDYQPVAAAGQDGLLEIWAGAAPETRAGILLNVSWASRDLEVDPASVGAQGAGYVEDFHGYAAGWDAEDSEGYHGLGFPAMPLPGQAGELASSLGFDRDGTEISLRVALALLAPVRKTADGG